MWVFMKFQNMEVCNSQHSARGTKAPKYVRKSQWEPVVIYRWAIWNEGLCAWRSESTELQVHPWHINTIIVLSTSSLS